MFEKGAAFGAASFCIQNYFQRVVAYVCESFYNKEHPQGQDISKGVSDKRNLSLTNVRGDTSE